MIYLLQIWITNATLPDPSSGHSCGSFVATQSLFTQLTEQEDIVQMQQEVLLLLNLCGLLYECSNCCWWFNIHLWRFAGGKLIFVHSNLQFSCIVLWIWYPVFPMFCYRDLLLCFIFDPRCKLTKNYPSIIEFWLCWAVMPPLYFQNLVVHFI
jgi:hypothetical protein